MGYFPNEKLIKTWKPREEDLLLVLRRGMPVPPVDIRLIDADAPAEFTAGMDAIAEVTWGFQTERFGVEVKTGSQPSIVMRAAMQAERGAEALGIRPMVFVPYLSEELMTRLAAREVSGIDLCGNAVILGKAFQVWRSGAPNRYKESRSIQNPYSGESSVFARAFLLQAGFGSLTELRTFTQAKSDPRPAQTRSTLLLGTASKVVSALEEELIVAKTPEGIQLLDEKRLLNKLRQRYRRLPTPSLLGKTPLSTAEIWSKMALAREQGSTRAIATGIASAGFYGVLSGVERLSLYIDDIAVASELLEVKPGRAFANIELIEDRKELSFFDARVEGDTWWASPIQTWLELAQGGPREQEAGNSLERQLSARLRDQAP